MKLIIIILDVLSTNDKVKLLNKIRLRLKDKLDGSKTSTLVYVCGRSKLTREKHTRSGFGSVESEVFCLILEPSQVYENCSSFKFMDMKYFL
jgi:hypothetical protein